MTTHHALVSLVGPCFGVFSAAVFRCVAVARAGRRGAGTGTAIIDPFALRELDQGDPKASGIKRDGFSLRRFIPTARSDNTPILDDELFSLPSMAPVRKALDADFERYLAGHKASLPNETIGVGLSFDWQMFDRELLYSARARFVLAGVVNRMDRAYVSPETCGEVRLIYRLTRLDQAPVGETANSPRLPMTLNVILKAKGEKGGRTRRRCHELQGDRAAMARRAIGRRPALIWRTA